MLEFRDIVLKDKEWVDRLLSQCNDRGSEYTFSNNYNWRAGYHTQVAQHQNFYLMCSGKEEVTYLYPTGTGDFKEVILLLQEDATTKKRPFVLRSVTPEGKDKLETLFPQCFTFEACRDSFDYLYTVEKLSSLAGKKLHGKRNHIHRFEQNHPQWVYEPITPQNLQDCMEMNDEWCKQLGCEENPSLVEERCAVRSGFHHFFDLNLTGGLLRTEPQGKAVAFTFGSSAPNHDTFVVHVEKAFPQVQGAYPMMNREFVRHELTGYQYVNREDDLGEEGLRKAKLSYYPDLLEEKYLAVWTK